MEHVFRVARKVAPLKWDRDHSRRLVKREKVRPRNLWGARVKVATGVIGQVHNDAGRTSTVPSLALLQVNCFAADEGVTLLTEILEKVEHTKYGTLSGMLHGGLAALATRAGELELGPPEKPKAETLDGAREGLREP